MKTKNSRRLWLKFDRLLSKSLLRQFGILGVVLIFALGLSYLMLSWSGTQWKEFCEAEHLNQYLLPLYLLTDSNALNNLYMGSDNTHVHGWMLIASSLIFLFGAFVFNGIIIGIITNSIERRVNNHKEGRIHYLKSGHYIIMGYDEMVPSFISYILDKDKEAYILILTAKETTSIKEQLLKSFGEQQMGHVIINYGHRISTEAFKDIYLEAAEEVFVVGNHSNAAHDAINVECVDSICSYLKGQNQRPARITCVFKDLDTYAAFKTTEIFGDVKNLGVEFVPYNFYSGWAKQVFVKRLYRDFDNPGKEYRYPLVYGKGIKADDEKYVHLVFVGTTNFAVAFAMEAASVLHFPNGPKVKTRITFIDMNADKEKDEFITRNRHFFEVQEYMYRDLSTEPKVVPRYIGREYLKFSGKDANFLDVEFEFIKGDVFSRKVQDEISCWAEEHKKDKQCLSIFLALADQRQNFVLGMNMPDEVYSFEVPVFIRQNRSDNFVTNLRNADTKKKDKKLTYSFVNENGEVVSNDCDARYAHIYPFGMNETAFSADDHSLKRAKLINYLYETADYETYKFQGILVLDAIPESKIWDDANTYWQKLSVALKWSNLYNSYTMRTKQRTLRVMRGLEIDDESRDYDTLSDYEVELLAIVEHNRWNVEKLLMGYRKPRKEEDKYEYPDFVGKLKKNKELFIHHDIRPFGQLNTIKELDYEFSRYIPWIMKMTEK
ncbi:hypothetical protein L6466_04350 [Prevotella communis]|uniref:hypothetical protein n=1 Tax=Prevotella communis TaxID=2913614 RepID=UPI001EDC2209|nr:hypothetical protein [Prevotella communis]UKK66597.1 hypothetical protein L6464_08130 [Prevotella communis]UKK71263.1 hypothetical protein L6466_04350 [Prevotella communis]